MHGVSVFGIKKSAENVVKVLYLKSINNVILQIMSIFFSLATLT